MNAYPIRHSLHLALMAVFAVLLAVTALVALPALLGWSPAGGRAMAAPVARPLAQTAGPICVDYPGGQGQITDPTSTAVATSFPVTVTDAFTVSDVNVTVAGYFWIPGPSI